MIKRCEFPLIKDESLAYTCIIYLEEFQFSISEILNTQFLFFYIRTRTHVYVQLIEFNEMFYARSRAMLSQHDNATMSQ